MARNEILDSKTNSTLYEGIKKIAEYTEDISKLINKEVGTNDSAQLNAIYLDIKDQFSDDSFESTEHTDCTVDLCDQDGLSHSGFQPNNIVWVKRPLLPWFPGIIIDPNDISKDLLKRINASSPTKHLIDSWKKNENEKQFFVYLFHRKRLWLWVAESKIRPFCNENDEIFLEKAKHYCTDRYAKDLCKGYKRAKKLAYTESKEHHHYNFINLFRHLFYHNNNNNTHMDNHHMNKNSEN